MEYHLPASNLPQQGVKHVPRLQNKPTYSRPTRHTTLHLKLSVRAELERKAKEQNLSVSATGAAFLEWALQQSIYTQQGALLETIIDKSIGKHMRAYSDRQATLQVRNLVNTDMILAIATNILGRQTGMDEKTLQTILTTSHDKARARITRITPQLKTIIEAVKKLFDMEKKGGDG